jgi:glutathione peroxidase
MANNTNIYEFSVKNAAGEVVKLENYKNNVLLIVNTASACGYTPQYEGLEALYKKYRNQNFSVLAFPCNQFGSQEKGTESEIVQFCTLKYNVTFPIMAKINVNGPETIPLYSFLKASEPGILGTEMIKWNFTKFLIGKDGSVLKRYSPTTTPSEIEEDIKKAL